LKLKLIDLQILTLKRFGLLIQMLID